MGCGSSREASPPAIPAAAAAIPPSHAPSEGRGRDRAKPHDQEHAASFDAVLAPPSGRDAPAAVVAAADSGGTNPLVGAPTSGTSIHPDASLEFSAVLAADAPSVAEAAVRLTQRHRCITVVTGCDRGYELPEPSLAEHLGRMERRAAIAITVHGLTADVDQFAPDGVPAEVLAASTALCAAWLTEVRRADRALSSLVNPLRREPVS